MTGDRKLLGWNMAGTEGGYSVDHVMTQAKLGYDRGTFAFFSLGVEGQVASAAEGLSATGHVRFHPIVLKNSHSPDGGP